MLKYDKKSGKYAMINSDIKYLNNVSLLSALKSNEYTLATKQALGREYNKRVNEGTLRRGSGIAREPKQKGFFAGSNTFKPFSFR
jgi:hypothetical protein